MSDLLFLMVSRARALSPSSRRWRTFLRTLPIDPDALPRPVPEATERDFIICGAPRTGSTLLAAMLVQPPAVHTVMEPWDGMRRPPRELFAELRDRIRDGWLPTGKLDSGALARTGEVAWAEEGHSALTVPMSEDFVLGVKWPIYWRYLPHLTRTRFLITIRDPTAVIASFRRHGGRLRMGLDYDTPFNDRMNRQLESATWNLARRRIMLFDYIHERILPFLDRPNVLTVRYEDWFRDPGKLRQEIGDFLGVELVAGPARIRAPTARRLTEGERRLIRYECRTAQGLGYPWV